MDSSLATLTNRFGAVDTKFLARPLEVLDPPPPVTVDESTSVKTAIETLQQHHIGCLLVTTADNKLSGIFTERDAVFKLMLKEVDLKNTAITAIMTPNPKAESLTTTVAFALHLMAQGGYRHLPIIDKDSEPIGIVSVKDILDYIETEIVNQLVLSELS